MWNKTKSLYDTDAAYWYSQYEEQFLFEKGKLESQLAAARKRKGDDIFEFRMYGGILAALVLLVPLEAVFMLAGISIMKYWHFRSGCRNLKHTKRSWMCGKCSWKMA